MKSSITIKDVAKECGFSVATVSRVINNNYYVSPEVKKKVIAAISKLDYTPNSVARSLKSNSSGIIGYITADFSNSYHITIAKAVEDIVRPMNYNLIVCSSNNSAISEEQYLRLLMSKNVDGILLNSSGKNDDFILDVNKKIPMVLITRRLNTPGFHGDFADCNNVYGIYMLTKELLSLGHRDIFFVEGTKGLSNSNERLEGFQKAMAEYGILVNDDYPYRYEGDFSIESGAASISYLLNMKKRPTAIVSANNQMTIGVLKALKKFDVSIPDEISVAGFNSIDHMELFEHCPTVSSFDPYRIGLAAGRAILERIKDNSIDNREYIFTPTLIRGNTTAKLKK